MTWPANINVRLLQAERDLTRAERRTELAQTATATARTELEIALACLARERAKTAALQQALDQVHASTSWRLSRPVRTLSRLAASLRGGSQPSPGPVLPDEGPGRAEPPALPVRERAILQRLQREPD